MTYDKMRRLLTGYAVVRGNKIMNKEEIE